MFKKTLLLSWAASGLLCAGGEKSKLPQNQIDLHSLSPEKYKELISREAALATLLTKEAINYLNLERSKLQEAYKDLKNIFITTIKNDLDKKLPSASKQNIVFEDSLSDSKIITPEARDKFEKSLQVQLADLKNITIEEYTELCSWLNRLNK